MEERLDGNHIRMLHTILNLFQKQHPTKQLYSHLSHISKTIQIRGIRPEALLVKQEQIPNVTFLYGPRYVDAPVQADQQELTLAMCRHWILFGGLAESDGW